MELILSNLLYNTGGNVKIVIMDFNEEYIGDCLWQGTVDTWWDKETENDLNDRKVYNITLLDGCMIIILEED